MENTFQTLNRWQACTVHVNSDYKQIFIYKIIEDGIIHIYFDEIGKICGRSIFFSIAYK